MKEEYSTEGIRTVTPQEHVRLRPNMYFEECHKDGHLNSLLLESTCHAIDEFIDGNCTFIHFSVSDATFSLKYDAGMSLEVDQYGEYLPVKIFSQLFVCSNMKKHLAVGEEFCRLGIASVQWAAESCTVISVHEGKKGTFHFKKGFFDSMELEAAENEPNSIYFSMKMDPEVFQDLQFNKIGLNELLGPMRDKFPGLTLKIV
ncbi:MAG: hypothetical protein NXI10_00845 [bacterium]|nr:hypothetical protein [bacterium]